MDDNEEKELRDIRESPYMMRADEVTKHILADPVVNFVLSDEELGDLYKSDGIQAIDSVLKKSLALGKRVIISTPVTVSFSDNSSYRDVLELSDWHEKSTISNWSIGDQTMAAGEHFFFLPEYNPAVQTVYAKDVYIEESASNLTLMLSDPYLKYQFTDGQIDNNEHLGLYRLLLPSLKNLPMKMLAKLKSDNVDAFERLHRAEQKIVTGLSQCSSTQAIKHILEEVDSYIRDYKDSVSLLKRKHRKSLALAAMGMAGLSIPIIMPQEITKIIASVFGAFSFKDYFVKKIDIDDAMSKLEKNDLYAAVLLHKESQ